MTSEDALVASINELVHNFRSALVALVPAAERAKLIWDDVTNQHPDWEHLQACLFDVFVRRPIHVDRDRINGEFPLAPYDIDLPDYSRHSWIACTVESGNEWAFVRFLNRKEPFDTVEGVVIEPASSRRGRRVEHPLSKVEFLYIRRVVDGRTDRINRIETTA